MTIGVLHIVDNATSKPRPLNLATTSGVLSVDNSANTQPISGSVTVASGSVTVANSSIAVTGAFYPATQPVSIAGSVSTTTSASKDNQVLDSATSASTDDFSTKHDVSNYREVVLAGTHSASGNIEVWISEDDTTYYKHSYLQAYPDSDGSFSLHFASPFKYYKLKYKSAGTVTALSWAQA